MDFLKIKKMQNKILIFLLFTLNFSVYSQNKIGENNHYVDSIINSVELKLSKEINNINIKVLSEVSNLNKILDTENVNINKKTEKLKLRFNNSLKISDSLLLLNSELTKLIEENNSNLKLDISSVKEKIDLINKDLFEKDSIITNNLENIASTSFNLNRVINDFDESSQKVIVAISISLLLLLLVYIILNKKWTSETKKLSLRQKEIIEKQIEDSLKIADWLSEKSSVELSSSSETDHSFAKRVADEIVRMSTNLSRMDDSIRGFKQLSASVKKLIQSLNINEYEIVELLNKSYSPGMNLEANFVFNEDIEKGSAIITRIIKPQINYKGKMIQGAQVEVSQND